MQQDMERVDEEQKQRENIAEGRTGELNPDTQQAFEDHSDCLACLYQLKISYFTSLSKHFTKHKYAFFSLNTRTLAPVIHWHSSPYHCYAQIFLLFPPPDAQVKPRIAACLADISERMSRHHLKLNLDKTALVLLQGKGCLCWEPFTTADNTVMLNRAARNLGVTLDNELSFSPNTTAEVLFCAPVKYQGTPLPHLDTSWSSPAELLHVPSRQSQLQLPPQLCSYCCSPGVQPPWVFPHAPPLHSLHRLAGKTQIQSKSLMTAYSAVTSGFLSPRRSQTLHSLLFRSHGEWTHWSQDSIFCLKTHLSGLHLNTPW